MDGTLHVQIRYTDILHTEKHGFVTASDARGDDSDSALSHSDSLSWRTEGSGSTRSDSVEEYIFADCPRDLTDLVLTGKFITASPTVEGERSVAFPLSQNQAESAQ